MKLTETATWQETMAQPEIWSDWAAPLADKALQIREWIKAREIETVWLSGAGTSEFVGGVISAAPSSLRLENHASTDIVACPQDALNAKGRILSLQFGRSGDSSESVGVMALLDAHRPDIDRLHITCNADGALATHPAPGPGECQVLTLPAATHDRGFAMTSSFTTMLISALACLDAITEEQIKTLAVEARKILVDLAAAVTARPERAVFLGSGPLKSIARESALKVLELTAGQTVTQWDSTLGYRHGPKAAVNEDTHVYVMLHPDPQTARYDMDVASEIRAQYPNISVTTMGPNGDISWNSTGDALVDSVLYILLAQVRASQWSDELGLNVDDPFHGQNLTRVVSGVTLYPWAK
jgi:tagatose-6-phosphate ketose/aldose isomerase